MMVYFNRHGDGQYSKHQSHLFKVTGVLTQGSCYTPSVTCLELRTGNIILNLCAD